MFNKIRFWLSATRIGPDMVLTHWMLHFKSTMNWLCRKKLKHFGNESDVRPFSYLVEGHNISIGDRVVIRPSAMIFADDYAEIKIGNDVLIGAGVHMYVNDHKFDDPEKTIAEQGYYPSKNVIIEDDCWIGANAIILCGVRVGTHSVIAAGSIVRHDVEPYSVYAGVPAKKIKDIAK